MHFAVIVITLLVASSAVALENPHRKAVRPIKLDHGHLKPRAVTVADDGGYKYLNKQTQRVFNLPTSQSPGLMIVRISGKWHRDSRGGLRRGRILCRYPSQHASWEFQPILLVLPLSEPQSA